MHYCVQAEENRNQNRTRPELVETPDFRPTLVLVCVLFEFRLSKKLPFI